MMVIKTEGFHLFSSRTQKLRPHTPKILSGRLLGKIGSCHQQDKIGLSTYLFFYVQSYAEYEYERSELKRKKCFACVSV